MVDILCIGEALIDFVSRERGETLVTATQYTAATGGAPANVAAGVAKLGRSARLIATVGDDVFGHKIKHDLEELGVDCGALRMDAEHFTTLAFAQQGAAGERAFHFDAGAHDYLLPEQVTDDEIRNARILHYGAISFRTPESRETTLKALRLAKDAGVLTSCDPKWRPLLWSDHEAGRAALLEAIGGFFAASREQVQGRAWP